MNNRADASGLARRRNRQIYYGQCAIYLHIKRISRLFFLLKNCIHRCINNITRFAFQNAFTV